MSQKDKLIRKLKSRPKDFTYDEAETLLQYLTFRKDNKGKTSGLQSYVCQRKIWDNTSA